MTGCNTDIARRVLVVDDNKAVHRDFEMILCDNNNNHGNHELEGILFGEGSGVLSVPNHYEIGFAMQGREAVDMVRKALADGRPYMLAFIDVRMPPGWDGLETIERIWQVDPDIQIVICSSYSDYSWDEITKRFGRKDNLLILEKPFDIDEVQQMASTLTEKWLASNQAKASIEQLQRQVEQRTRQLEAEKRRLQEYLDVAGTMLVALDANLNVLMINKAGARILGYRQEDIIGKNWVENFIPKEYRAEVKAIRSEIQKGSCLAFENYENPVLTRENTKRQIAWHNAVIKDEQGRVEVILSSGEDITERLESEKTAKAAYARLEQANQELKEMHAQLLQKEKLASIGQLAAGVAHEINNPVGFISCNFEVLQGYAETLGDMVRLYDDFAAKAESLDGEKLTEKLADIAEWRREAKVDYIFEDMQQLFKDSREGLDRVTAIVQNLRGFSRIDQAAEVGEYDINEGIRSTAAIIENESKHHCDIVMDLGNVPRICCHAGQMNQVLLNIIANASQAIESQTRPDNGRIDIRTYINNNSLVCTITDDGPGIPKEHHSKIFDPFFTTKPVGKGTGLGLSVSYDIVVNKHNGRLYFDSTPNKGTTFTIELPLKNTVRETSI